MVVSYTNNFGYGDVYANKPINNLTTNADGGGNGGGGAFFKMFEEKESEVNRDTSVSSNPLDDLYPVQNGYYANENVIRDYIDNSLLLNTEQVACTNITQHLALKGNVKETLQFLNIQAAKNMVNSRKHKYNFKTEKNANTDVNLVRNNMTPTISTGKNFFEAKLNNPSVNFFMNKG